MNIALSDTNNEVVDFYSPEELFGKGSLSPIFTDVSERIQSITLDSLINQMKITNIALIKIDIEGFEYFTFLGAKDLLTSTNALIYYSSF